MKKLIALPLIFAAVSTPTLAQYSLDLSYNPSEDRQAPMIWTAFNLGGRSMTSSYDVKKFIATVHLTDQNMIDMFKDADGDYNKYEELKSEWAAKRLKSGIQQMAYLRMIQAYATRPQYGKERKAFTTTERDYFKEVQSTEDRALKELLNEGKGIVYARKRFGEQLIEIGYPHKKSQSAEDVYWSWYELQKERIKENMRIKETQKFEYLEALGYQKEFYVRPTEMFDLSDEVEKIIDNEINEQRVTQNQVGQIIEKDARIKVVAKDIKFLGPETTKLSELKHEAPAVYKDFMQNIDKNVIEFIDNSFEANVLRYEAVAAQMAQKYKSAGEIKKLSDQMKKEFLVSNDYNRLMMSKIYDLAITGIEENIYAKANKATNQKRDQYISVAAKEAKAFLENEDLILSETNTGVRLEDNFQGYMSRIFSENKMTGIDSESIKASAYLNEIKNMSHWVLKFQIKKASMNTIPMAMVTKYDVNSFEGQERIEKFLKNKQYEDNLNAFKTGKFKAYWNGMLTINPTGLDYLLDTDAVDFVLGIEKEKEQNQGFNLFGN